jgi:hypothetical protein
MKMHNITPQYLYDKGGKKTFVVLPIEDYSELIEDLYDLSVINERKDEPRISFEEFEKGLIADGLL